MIRNLKGKSSTQLKQGTFVGFVLFFSIGRLFWHMVLRVGIAQELCR